MEQVAAWDHLSSVYDAYANLPFGAAEIAALTDLAPPPADLLELGCGTGRATLPLAAAGYRVAGIDNSLGMLERLQEKSGASTVKLLRGDFTTYVLPDPVDLIVCLYDTFTQATTAAAQRSLLATAKRNLRPNGCLLIEVTNPALVYQQCAWNTSVRPTRLGESGTSWFHAAKLDPVTQQLVVSWIRLRGGRVDEYVQHQRIVWPHELRLMTELSGLRVDTEWGDWNQSRFNRSSPLYLVKISHSEAG